MERITIIGSVWSITWDEQKNEVCFQYSGPNPFTHFHDITEIRDLKDILSRMSEI